MKDMDTASIIRFTAALLGMLQLVSSQIFGFEIGQETVDATIDLVSAALVTYAMWKNNYLSSKGKKQEQALKVKGLK